MFNQFYQLANRLVQGGSGGNEQDQEYAQVPSSTDDDTEQQQRKPRSSSIKGGDDPVILGTITHMDSNSKFLNMLGNMKQHASDFNLQQLTDSVTSMQERTAQQVSCIVDLCRGVLSVSSRSYRISIRLFGGGLQGRGLWKASFSIWRSLA